MVVLSLICKYNFVLCLEAEDKQGGGQKKDGLLSLSARVISGNSEDISG